MHAPWPTEYVLLGLLVEQPMHGYELAQRLQSDPALGAIWRIERSQVYFLLGKLIERGHIEEAAAQAGGGPPRVVYVATAGGRSALLAWLCEPEASPRSLRSAFLAKLYLAARSYPEIAASLLAAQKQSLAAWSAQHSADAAGSDFAALVHRIRLAQVRGALAALDEVDLAALRQAGQAG